MGTKLICVAEIREERERKMRTMSGLFALGIAALVFGFLITKKPATRVGAEVVSNTVTQSQPSVPNTARVPARAHY